MIHQFMPKALEVVYWTLFSVFLIDDRQLRHVFNPQYDIIQWNTERFFKTDNVEITFVWIHTSFWKFSRVIYSQDIHFKSFRTKPHLTSIFWLLLIELTLADKTDYRKMCFSNFLSMVWILNNDRKIMNECDRSRWRFIE